MGHQTGGRLGSVVVSILSTRGHINNAEHQAIRSVSRLPLGRRSVSSQLLGLVLLNGLPMGAGGSGMDLNCTNDYELRMSCRVRVPAAPHCAHFSVRTAVPGSGRSTEGRCNLTEAADQTGTCSCSMDMPNGFVLGEHHNTSLWEHELLVDSKSINVHDNIKPKAPTIISVDPVGGNWVVKWVTNYNKSLINLRAVVTYHKSSERREKGTVAGNTSSTSYLILGELLEPRTEYLVNVRSHWMSSSESSEDFKFTTRMSSGTIAMAVILSLCVAAVIITSFLYLLYARVKEKWWDNVGKYKNSTLLVMVPGEHKVLMLQKTAICSVYVDSRKEDKDDEQPWDSSSSTNSYQNAGADSASSLGYSQKVSVDIISNVEDAMRRAFPQISLLPTMAPWLCMAHRNAGYDPVPGTSSLCSFENRTYSMVPPSGTQGLSTAAMPALLSESFFNASMNPSPDSQVPIFQLTGQRQPLVSRLNSSDMKTDFSYQSWNADSGSLSPTDALQADLLYSSSPSNTTSSSILSGFGSSVSGVCSTGELWSEKSPICRVADPSSMTDYGYGEEEPDLTHGKVCESNVCEESSPAPACSLVPMDDDYQGFQSMVRRPGVLIPGSGPRDRLDELSETLFTGMPQRVIDAATPSMVNALPTTSQEAQGLLEPQANKASVLPADQHKLIIISDYHTV